MSLQHYLNYDTCAQPAPQLKAYEPNENAFCARIPFEAMTDPCTPTLNKKLTGTANPRTLTKPTIAPKSHDITYWRQNPSINHSQINQKTPMCPSWAGFDMPANASGKDAGTSYPTPAVDFDVEIHSPYLNPIQPDVYTATDQFQPINNNLGIAMTPSFPNTVLEDKVAGNEIFYDTNRREYFVPERPFKILAPGGEPEAAASRRELVVDARPDNNVVLDDYIPFDSATPDRVYDPRFTGYGPGNRSYTDAQLGAPRYYYDDINAIRMPNYLTRSKLDSCVTPFGDAYGKLNSGHLPLAEAKRCAEQSWVQNSVDFRTNLSKSLLRKRNEEMVQIRQAPKYTLGPA